MGIKGKIFGGTFGFFVGGPLGAVLGATIGHNIYDRAETSVIKSTQDKQTLVFLAIFSLLGKIAKADGKYSQSEISAVKNFINNNMRLNTNEADMAMKIFYEAERVNYSHSDFAKQIFTTFRNDPQLLRNITDIVVKVAAADGSIDPEEEKIIADVASIFNISKPELDRIKAFYIDNTNKYYKILNVSKTASNQEIKKQYRKLISEYHPDKIISKNLPDEFVKFSHDKFREIQEAYEAIKKERGI